MKRLIVLAATLGLLIGAGTVAAPTFGYVGYAANVPTIPCKIANVQTTCEIDTGNDLAGIIVGSNLAGRLHLNLTASSEITTVLGTSPDEQGFTTLTALGRTIKVPVTVYPEFPIAGNIGPLVLHKLGATMKANFNKMDYSITSTPNLLTTKVTPTVTRVGPYTDMITWTKDKGAVYTVAVRKGSDNVHPSVLLNGKQVTHMVINANSVIVGLTNPSESSVRIEIEPNYNWSKRVFVTLKFDNTGDAKNVIHSSP